MEAGSLSAGPGLVLACASSRAFVRRCIPPGSTNRAAIRHMACTANPAGFAGVALPPWVPNPGRSRALPCGRLDTLGADANLRKQALGDGGSAIARRDDSEYGSTWCASWSEFCRPGRAAVCGHHGKPARLLAACLYDHAMYCPTRCCDKGAELSVISRGDLARFLLARPAKAGAVTTAMPPV